MRELKLEKVTTQLRDYGNEYWITIEFNGKALTETSRVLIRLDRRDSPEEVSAKLMDTSQYIKNILEQPNQNG